MQVEFTENLEFAVVLFIKEMIPPFHLAQAVHSLRHLYDWRKKAITEFCMESIVATIASVIDANGSKTEETMHFCFFVVLPPQGKIGLTKLLASNGQSICLLRQNQ